MKCRLLFSLLLLFCLHAGAALRPISSVTLPPEMMPLEHSVPWQDKPLRVGILRDNSTPWNMVVGNDLYGINADYLVALTQTSGMKFEVEAYADWPALRQALHQGQLDMAFGVAQQTMDKGMSATQPWFTSPLRIYRSRDNLRPVMFNSADARITLSRSALALVTADFAKRHRWQVVDNDLQALYALLNNQSDYVVADETSAGFLLSQLQQGQIYQLASPLEPGELKLQAITTSPTLTAQLDSAIRQLPMEVVNGIQGRWSSQLPRYQDTNTAHLSPMERSWMEQHPVVTYAAISDNYPWSYRAANGQPSGYSVELLNIIGQNTGLRFQPWWVSNAQQAQALVDQGRAMIQLTLPLTGDDAMRSNTLPVWRALWGVYVSQTSRPVTSWQQLKGHKVGIRRGDIAQQLVPTGIDVVTFEDSKTLYDALANGQIEALVDNVISARWLIQSRYSDALRLAFAASDTAWPIALGVSPSFPLLRTLLNSSLQQIPADTQQRMRETWSNNSSALSGERENQMRPISLFVLVAALFAIVFLLILLLRRYLEQRRERLQRRQLEQQREEAERANQMKSQFLATVSHELRTPMQAILGLLEVEVSRQPASHNLTVIHNSASTLLTLLNDLQDHAKLENNSFTLLPQPLDPAKWLSRLADFYHPLMRKNGPVFSVEAIPPLPSLILIDGQRLQQIANNLISNAIKFTHRGAIRVTLGAENDRLRLQVIDTGSGIPRQEQERLFEPWYQTPSGRQLSVQGSGLGLSICKEIVTRMDGEIQLESTPGKGTTLTVLLPLRPLARDSAVPEDAPARFSPLAASPLRVAVVDDHPTNLLVMQQQLAWFGIEADCYPDGRALLTSDTLYDLLFVDFSMPHPDGLTVAKIIRRRERSRIQRCRIVMCSADADILAKPQVVALTDRVLLKPVTLREIGPLLAHAADPTFKDLASRLWQLSGQNQAFFSKLQTTLRQTLADDRGQLTRALQEAEWEKAEKAAHRLKGSWQMLGYDAGERLCQQLIEQCRKRQQPAANLNLLISLTDSLLTELESYGAYPL